MKGLLNVVDLLAILPFWIELSLSICGFDVENLRDIKGGRIFCNAKKDLLFVLRRFSRCAYNAGSACCANSKAFTLFDRHANIRVNTSSFWPPAWHDGNGVDDWRRLLLDASLLR